MDDNDDDDDDVCMVAASQVRGEDRKRPVYKYLQLGHSSV